MSSYIQSVYFDWTNTSIPNRSFSNPVAAHSAIVIFIWSYAGMGTVTGVSDGTNTYNEVGSKYYPSSTWSCQIFVATDVAAGSPSITFTVTGSYFVVEMLEYGNASAVDQTAQGYGGASPFSLGPSGMTTQNDEVVVAGFWSVGIPTAVLPYTPRINVGNTLDYSNQMIEDQDVTSMAAYTATATCASSGWVGRLVTLKIGGGPPPPPSAVFPNVSTFWM